ncbi:hypothetical protein Pint_07156 [Pistacia integerrima]|uniref:Uncharacterized protein n=1 Tax=Pistacia integerrima TaxID=434235 RepID=A0ACC0XX93_9ROSI|nr:hypothetical protein Pint_07156 [Pistacia integerrima]
MLKKHDVNNDGVLCWEEIKAVFNEVGRIVPLVPSQPWTSLRRRQQGWSHRRRRKERSRQLYL